jgi:hypothetical protein
LERWNVGTLKENTVLRSALCVLRFAFCALRSTIVIRSYGARRRILPHNNRIIPWEGIDTMNRSNVIKRICACAIAGAVIATALPTTTAYMQGDSPLPTPEPTAVPQPTTAPVKPAPVPTRKPGARPPAPPKITTQVITETGLNPDFIIDVKYPMAPPEGNNNTFNVTARGMVDVVIDEFKTDVAAAGVITDMPTFTNSLYIDYKIVRNAKNIISVRFTNSVYFAGAAHPNNFTRVLNFDFGTGAEIQLSEVFKPGVDYLTTLSNYCRRVLQRRGVLDFPEGADPKPENYQNWNMGLRNLVITFDQYQVAPYALGPQECQVPLVTLRRLLAEPSRW